MTRQIVAVSFMSVFLCAGRVDASPQTQPAPAGDATDTENRKLAFEAFKSGVTLYDAGDYEAASKAFREANQYKFNWKILYNIGQCEAAAKRYGLALAAFEEYLALSGDEISVARRDEVMSEVARLRLIVGMLEVKAPKGASVQVDGVERGVAPLSGPVLISAGVEHNVIISKAGEVLLEETVKLTGGQDRTLRVGTESERVQTGAIVVAADDGKAAIDERPGKKARRLKTAGWALLGTGTLMVASGLILGGVGYAKANDLNDEYDGIIPASKKSEVDRLNGMSLLADIFMGVGTGLALTGVIVLVVHKRKYAKHEVVALSPTLSPGFVGGVIGGRF